ncbi:2-C-methyl-D-erythritol 4-phosphate cytidylyltransferase [Rhodococcus oryzae]|uniref:2-C-methyl-D-erythritol 4-phosphate cytidylyltransferase n=1 Tax=Rhodococcus oryzae TaxID=2571143 RepID=A0ABY2RG48_9NOCA|nr:2-C-methyl-D-erythritol 4-phosphate cytidylyltransferase [Rhodococcus oryzae]
MFNERGPVVNNEFDEVGPIDYLVVEFPADRQPDGSALPMLRDLVDNGIIRVLDLVFVRKDTDGSLAGIAIDDLGLEGGIDVTLFAEASSGLVNPSDVEEAGAILEPGCSGAILVYENLWAAPFAAALRRGGAQLVASGRIPLQGIMAALDSLDANN